MLRNNTDNQTVSGITFADGAPINDEQEAVTGIPITQTDEQEAVTGILTTQSQERTKKAFSQLMGGLLLIGGSAGMIYGMAMLAMLIKNHFQNVKENDLMVGNPSCWDGSGVTPLFSCASNRCTNLQTITDASNWISNHPIDLAGISAIDVFNQCQAYINKCAAGSGFTTPFKAGQDGAFDLNCDHPLTNYLGEGFSWFGYALLSIVALVATAAMLRKSHYCFSNFFKTVSEDSNSENQSIIAENDDRTSYTAV